MKKKVLVTDDDLGIRKFYEIELKREGYDVILASNAQEALASMKDDQPDLVIMDIRMPGMDGVQTMELMLEENNELPVIINSAYSSYKDNYMSWSADAYLVKSSDTTELKSTVRSLLERSVVL